MIQKAAIEMLIGLATGMIAMKTVVTKGSVIGVVNINRDDMYKEMASME